MVPLIPAEFGPLIAAMAAVESLMTDVDQVKKVQMLQGLVSNQMDTFIDWIANIQSSDVRSVVRAFDDA